MRTPFAHPWCGGAGATPPNLKFRHFHSVTRITSRPLVNRCDARQRPSPSSSHVFHLGTTHVRNQAPADPGGKASKVFGRCKIAAPEITVPLREPFNDFVLGNCYRSVPAEATSRSGVSRYSREPFRGTFLSLSQYVFQQSVNGTVPSPAS